MADGDVGDRAGLVALADGGLTRARHHGLAVDREAAVADRVEQQYGADQPLDLDVAMADAVAPVLQQRHRGPGDLDGDRDLLVGLDLAEGERAEGHPPT